VTAIALEAYDPMDPATQQDPFPYYAALRRRAPVFRGENGMYFVSGHNEVHEVLRQPNRFSSQWGNSAGFPSAPGAEAEIAAIEAEGYPGVSTMLTLDPPHQTRYRRSVGRAFSARRIRSLEPSIRAIAKEVIDAWPEGRVDFMRSLAIPFPVRVIAQMLSIPPEREADVKRWSDDSVAAIGVKITPERAIEAARSILEMQHYLASLIRERRERPQDDFLSELAAADFEQPDGPARKLEMAEMLSIVQQLMVAGNEATTKGITEVMKLLIENPEQWERIQRAPRPSRP